MIVTAYIVAGALFTVGMYQIASSRRRRIDLTDRLMRYQPIEIQARHWLDQRRGLS
jgi:hypothetical protein